MSKHLTPRGVSVRLGISEVDLRDGLRLAGLTRIDRHVLQGWETRPPEWLLAAQKKDQERRRRNDARRLRRQAKETDQAAAEHASAPTEEENVWLLLKATGIAQGLPPDWTAVDDEGKRLLQKHGYEI